MSDIGPGLDYAQRQSRQIVDRILEDEDVHEAVENAIGWAFVAYDKLAEHHPPLYVASHVTGMINAVMMQRAFEPPT